MVNKREDWTAAITELEMFFKSASIPAQIRLNDHSMILDTNKFIQSHLSVLKAQNGKRAFLLFLTRLENLKNIISNGKSI